MGSRVVIVALVLFLAVAAYADTKAPTAAPTIEDRPKALTPFASSPSMEDSLAASPTSEYGDDDDAGGQEAALGSPTSSAAYGPLDSSKPSAAVAVGVSSVAAVSVAAAAGYLLL